MMLRERIKSDLERAKKEQDRLRLSMLRLICAAIKDRDIAFRSDGRSSGVSDREILDILTKMIQQRNASVTAYEEAGRLESAERERSEISVIREFLPRQMTDVEMQAAVRKAISAVGAESIRDMGRVMGELKSSYPGQMDFGKAGEAVRQLIC